MITPGAFLSTGRALPFPQPNGEATSTFLVVTASMYMPSRLKRQRLDEGNARYDILEDTVRCQHAPMQ